MLPSDSRVPANTEISRRIDTGYENGGTSKTVSLSTSKNFNISDFYVKGTNKVRLLILHRRISFQIFVPFVACGRERWSSVSYF